MAEKNMQVKTIAAVAGAVAAALLVVAFSFPMRQLSTSIEKR